MSNASTGTDAPDADRNTQSIDDANDRAFDPTYSSSNSGYAATVGSGTVSVTPAEQSARSSQSSEQSSGSPTQPLGETSLRRGGARAQALSAIPTQKPPPSASRPTRRPDSNKACSPSSATAS